MAATVSSWFYSWHNTGGSDQDNSQEKEIKKAKWLSEEALQIAEKR